MPSGAGPNLRKRKRRSRLPQPTGSYRSSPSPSPHLVLPPGAIHNPEPLGHDVRSVASQAKHEDRRKQDPAPAAGSGYTAGGGALSGTPGAADEADADADTIDRAVRIESMERVPLGKGVENPASGDEDSVESLVRSLMRSLRTEQGRKDFERLAKEDREPMEPAGRGS